MGSDMTKEESEEEDAGVISITTCHFLSSSSQTPLDQVEGVDTEALKQSEKIK